MHIVRGHNDPLQGKLCLEQLLKGLRRTKPTSKDARLPITLAVLTKIHKVLSNNAKDPVNVMMWAACGLSYFAFLRSGEF